MSKLVYLFVLSVIISLSDASQLIRGVHPKLAPFYAADSKEFQCLDGSMTIPFELVNDDYCDCEDGSDEPGTSACTKARFYCHNVGHQPSIILSSRVNDGICDCCDGADEWDTEVQCENNCKILGEEARKQAEAEAIKLNEGLEAKKALIRQGEETKAEKQTELDQLEKELEIAQELLKEKEDNKNKVEEVEKEALDRHNAEQEKIRLAREEAEKLKEKVRADGIFISIDLNGDKILSKEEIMTSKLFDQDGNGEVSEEEAAFFMSHSDEVSEEDFHSTMWLMLKAQLDAPKPSITDPIPQDPEQPQEDQVSAEEHQGTAEEVETGQKEALPEEDEDYPYEGEDLNDDEAAPGPDDHYHEEEQNQDSYEPPAQEEYDEDTKAKVDAANEARDAFQSVRQETKDLEHRVSELKKTLEIDYGKENEYAALAKNCYELIDHEYVYKICLFDYCSQKPKNGGSETRLGKWERWDDDNETIMYFGGGAQCWNGPQRSTKVHVSCSSETRLVSVSEPSKCEYVMHLEIPSACRAPTSSENNLHDEL